MLTYYIALRVKEKNVERGYNRFNSWTCDLLPCWLQIWGPVLWSPPLSKSWCLHCVPCRTNKSSKWDVVTARSILSTLCAQRDNTLTEVPPWTTLSQENRESGISKVGSSFQDTSYSLRELSPTHSMLNTPLALLKSVNLLLLDLCCHTNAPSDQETHPSITLLKNLDDFKRPPVDPPHRCLFNILNNKSQQLMPLASAHLRKGLRTRNVG